MTILAVETAELDDTRHWSTAGVVAVGCALLVLRPVLYSHGHVVAVAVVLFAGLAAAGLGWRVASAPGALPTSTRRRVLVLAAGVGAFALARVIGGGEAPGPAVLRLVALNSLAAVAEEAFFRKLAFDAASDHGPAYAVIATSVLFAAVHVTVYGVWVLPLDLAAGLVFGWQRWASGSWVLPAATHVVANLLVVLP